MKPKRAKTVSVAPDVFLASKPLDRKEIRRANDDFKVLCRYRRLLDELEMVGGVVTREGDLARAQLDVLVAAGIATRKSSEITGTTYARVPERVKWLEEQLKKLQTKFE